MAYASRQESPLDTAERVSAMFRKIEEIRAQRTQRKISTDLVTILAGGGTQQDVAQYLSGAPVNVGQATYQKPQETYARGAKGFLQRLLATVDPNAPIDVSSFEAKGPAFQQLFKGAFPTPLEETRQKYYERLGEPKKKALSGTDWGYWEQLGYTAKEGKEKARKAADYKAGLRGRPTGQQRTDAAYWRKLGYNPKQAHQFARLSAEIAAGIKPRASSTKDYDKMSAPEKMKFLQTLKRSAEGPYFGVEGGNVEPLEPRVVKWASKELAELPMFKDPEKLAPATYDGWIGPPEGLESIWEGLNFEERTSALEALQQGITPEKILNYFNKHK